MTIRVGINGFGRIGRLFFRAAIAKKELEIVGINDLFAPKVLAHLLKYDSVHGKFEGTIEAKEKSIVVNGKEIAITAEKDPTTLPWKALNVDVVVESTGKFAKRDEAMKHIAAGAKKVLISAPAGDADATFVIGVNEHTYDKTKHVIVSNASCTTNCLAPAAKVVMEKFGIKRGLMTTIHSYTNDQVMLDMGHKKDMRRARAGAVSMIPTSTGAAKAVGLVLPELKGKLDGFAMRVPTPNVSVVDLVCETEKSLTKDELIAAFKEAANGKLKGILAVSEEPLVSCDFNHSSFSSIIDTEYCSIIDNNFVKIISWYDNEWGYSCRMAELIILMMK
ncbi:MAG TPA: type I glyceraldehyde-3-phosphate dehydrogenase [Candidatus Sumerlaeota bacterium]|jgi:glyceraldehyde 3-phosphate dehydrogenase|nr:MAG: Glyceraldehyde-3-phosphate dehydrogenase [candidate division BRC1 bacterium ADurb.Bin183]HOE64359.1 type I glyceraldehyde-3-phosphate dehydrogenase [Candidatus Sumerlaeota bacterium]HRR31334.1 type I glyceraldehyde-3-phosphate dehydrogenase [Candidatus Sumerlaeia bacterium]HON50841.1 type I glyceraldehyde-3-phosphate dehydrogenase [Candidatus Sumerlaeota bacterium]HOR65535.1 type I glyceraldehyde-3-phosphate dehydrogenase [Candidatus Sumerlaeota bacterium]